MIDTHTHLYTDEFEDGGEAAVRRAIESGVDIMIFPNIDVASIGPMTQLHLKFPLHTKMAMGLHPTDIGDDYEEVLLLMEKELDSGKYIAVGEVGIDLYWDKSRLELQKDVFRRQLISAQKRGLPVIIHCRDAFPETIEVIKEVNLDVPLVFHSFTGSTDDVKAIREVCDAYFGINGVVTYKNASTLRDALPVIGENRILLETDSPYLSPVPLRGKRNESANLGFIRDKIAEAMNLSPETIEKRTTENARKIFKL